MSDVHDATNRPDPSDPGPEEVARRLQEENRRLAAEAAAARQRAEELERVLDQTEASYQQLREEHRATVEELEWYKRHTFGRRRERFRDDPNQLSLFELPDAGEGEKSSQDACGEVEVQPHRRRRQRREIDWDRLPNVRHEHDVPPEEKVCSCGREKCKIGEDVTRELEYQPAKLVAHIHVMPKYACPHCKDGVTTAAPPQPRPIRGGIAGPGLLAAVITGKLSDHLPLYRLEDILSRYGVHFSRSTLCGWVRQVAGLFEPLYRLERERVLQSPVLWTDDTPVTVLGGPQGSFRGHFWTYIGDDAHPYSVYDFTTRRNRDGPADFLRGFSGYLHADAFSGYDAIYLNGSQHVVEVACWAHARRKFFDASKHYPRHCHQVLEWIGQLFDIEDRAAGLSVEARRTLRQREAVPILERIEKLVRELSATSLPKSTLRKAVTYALNQWEALCRYTEDGRLSIDNNVSERTLRHQAVGRKNWLFLGNDEAGHRAAVLYTILAGAKRHRIDPWFYVRDLLLKTAAGTSDLEPLLPDRWAAAHPERILTHRIDESRERAARTRRRRAQRRLATGR